MDVEATGVAVVLGVPHLPRIGIEKSKNRMKYRRWQEEVDNRHQS